MTSVHIPEFHGSLCDQLQAPHSVIGYQRRSPRSSKFWEVHVRVKGHKSLLAILARSFYLFAIAAEINC